MEYNIKLVHPKYGVIAKNIYHSRTQRENQIKTYRMLYGEKFFYCDVVYDKAAEKRMCILIRDRRISIALSKKL